MLEVNNTNINYVMKKRPIIQIWYSVDHTLCLYVSKLVHTMLVSLNVWVIVFGLRSDISFIKGMIYDTFYFPTSLFS